MRFNDATMKLMENIRYCLDVERFPELKPFEERIAAFDMDEIEDKTSYSLDTPDDPASPLVFGSGLGVHVFSKRAQEAVGPMVQGYLTLIHEIRSDKKLMEKEVHLNQYLGYMEEMIGRALSDRVDAFDPYQSELCSVDSVLASKITVIPHTGEASPEAKAVFTHLDNAAKLYRFKADARDGLVPEITSDTEYIEQTWKKTDACKQSAAGLADLTDQQISSFGEEYCRIKRGKWNRFAQDGITTSLRDGIRKKHGIPGALRQIEQEQRMMYHGVLPETTSIIREIAFQLKGPFGEIASAGYTPEQVQGDRGEILGIYKQLMDSCNSAITTDGITGGFNTVEEEERFLLSVQASIMEAEHRLATASKIDISHMTEEEVDIMQVGTTRANNMCDQLARPQGVKNRLASELDPRTLSGPGTL